MGNEAQQAVQQGTALRANAFAQANAEGARMRALSVQNFQGMLDTVDRNIAKIAEQKKASKLTKELDSINDYVAGAAMSDDPIKTLGGLADLPVETPEGQAAIRDATERVRRLSLDHDSANFREREITLREERQKRDGEILEQESKDKDETRKAAISSYNALVDDESRHIPLDSKIDLKTLALHTNHLLQVKRQELMHGNRLERDQLKQRFGALESTKKIVASMEELEKRLQSRELSDDKRVGIQRELQAAREAHSLRMAEFKIDEDPKLSDSQKGRLKRLGRGEISLDKELQSLETDINGGDILLSRPGTQRTQAEARIADLKRQLDDIANERTTIYRSIDPSYAERLYGPSGRRERPDPAPSPAPQSGGIPKGFTPDDWNRLSPEEQEEARGLIEGGAK